MKKLIVLMCVIGWVGMAWGDPVTRYLRSDGRSGNAPFTSDVENTDPTRVMVPSNGYLTGLYCKYEDFRGADTATFTVRKNRGDTILTCETNSRESECRGVGRVVVQAGDVVSVKVVDTNISAAPVVYCSIYYDLQ